RLTLWPASFSLPAAATPAISSLSLHDALPIYEAGRDVAPPRVDGHQPLRERAHQRHVDCSRDAPGALRRRDHPPPRLQPSVDDRSEEHTSELQSLAYLVCRLLLEKKKINSFTP